MKIKQKIEIGSETHFIEINSQGTGNKAYIDADELIAAQRSLAVRILLERKHADDIQSEHINFFINTSGMKVKEIAMYLAIDPALLSQWRKNKNISNIGWLSLRIFFLDLFQHGAITLDVLKKNHQAA